MSDSDVEKTTNYPSEKAFDHGHGEVTIVDDHGADCELQRRLSTRHITMIALGMLQTATSQRI
jgi:amino acid permease